MTYRYLRDLAAVARRSGLRVVEIEGWQTRGRPASTGGFDPRGVLCHHTGSADTNPASVLDDLAYARWLARDGRSDLPAPLAQLSLGRDSTVYVCAAGRANHAGKARASGPMPATSDGNNLYLGIEAQNNGTEGWAHRGTDAAGRTVTQLEGYARLVAAVNDGYGFPTSHTRAHRETSVTGKWDPGGLDMDKFRQLVDAVDLDNLEDPDMEPKQIAGAPITLTDPGGKKVETTVQGALDDTRDRVLAGNAAVREVRDKLIPELQRDVAAILAKLDELAGKAPGA